MSRSSGSEPSCVTQSALGMWVWLRHKVDPSLRRATATILAGNSLENAKQKIQSALDDYVDQEVELQEEFRKATVRINQIKNPKMREREIKSLAPKLLRLKRIQSQVHSHSNQVNILERQIDSFQTDVVQTELLSSLRASITVLRQTSTDKSQNDGVDATIDEMDEILSNQQSFNESLSVAPQQYNSMTGSEDSDIISELFLMFDDENNMPPPGSVMKTKQSDTEECPPVHPQTEPVQSLVLSERSVLHDEEDEVYIEQKQRSEVLS